MVERVTVTVPSNATPSEIKEFLTTKGYHGDENGRE